MSQMGTVEVSTLHKLMQVLSFCELNRVEVEFEGPEAEEDMKVYAAYRHRPYIVGEFGKNVLDAVTNLKRNMEEIGAPIVTSCLYCSSLVESKVDELQVCSVCTGHLNDDPEFDTFSEAWAKQENRREGEL